MVRDKQCHVLVISCSQKHMAILCRPHLKIRLSQLSFQILRKQLCQQFPFAWKVDHFSEKDAMKRSWLKEHFSDHGCLSLGKSPTFELGLGDSVMNMSFLWAANQTAIPKPCESLKNDICEPWFAISPQLAIAYTKSHTPSTRCWMEAMTTGTGHSSFIQALLETTATTSQPSRTRVFRYMLPVCKECSKQCAWLTWPACHVTVSISHTKD